jgi:hypothetical protein
MNVDLEQRRLDELLDRLDLRLKRVQVLAEIIQDNLALRKGIPGPYLDNVREGALVDAVIHLSRRNLEDFWQLVKLEQLPLGRGWFEGWVGPSSEAAWVLGQLPCPFANEFAPTGKART